MSGSVIGWPMTMTRVMLCFLFFLFVNLFCTLLETVSIIFVVFIRFVLTSLLHARICGVLVGRFHED